MLNDFDSLRLSCMISLAYHFESRYIPVLGFIIIRVAVVWREPKFGLTMHEGIEILRFDPPYNQMGK